MESISSPEVLSQSFTDALKRHITWNVHFARLAKAPEMIKNSLPGVSVGDFCQMFCDSWLDLNQYDLRLCRTSEYRWVRSAYPNSSHVDTLRSVFWRYAFGTKCKIMNVNLESHESADEEALEKLFAIVEKTSQDELECAIMRLTHIRRDHPGNFRGYFLELIRGDEV